MLILIDEADKNNGNGYTVKDIHEVAECCEYKPGAEECDRILGEMVDMNILSFVKSTRLYQLRQNRLLEILGNKTGVENTLDALSEKWRLSDD
jgi:hypothetical protein